MSNILYERCISCSSVKLCGTQKDLLYAEQISYRRLNRVRVVYYVEHLNVCKIPNVCFINQSSNIKDNICSIREPLKVDLHENFQYLCFIAHLFNYCINH